MIEKQCISKNSTDVSCVATYIFKSQVELFEMRCFTMFITALRVIFLIKLQWHKNKSLYDSEKLVPGFPTPKESNSKTTQDIVLIGAVFWDRGGLFQRRQWLNIRDTDSDRKNTKKNWRFAFPRVKQASSTTSP